MSKKKSSSPLAAAALAAALAAATPSHAFTVPQPAVTLTGWAYGNGNVVQASTPVGSYAGYAGGFGGSLAGTAYDTASFLTYCIEIDEHFWFSPQAMTGYHVVWGADYFQQRRGNAGIADEIGALLTYADTVPVASAGASTALQLAIWNLVYDTDRTLAAGSFSDASAWRDAATALLAGSAGVGTSGYDIYALEKAGSQDFLLAVARPTASITVETDVPEPGTLALVAAAGLAAAWSRARRR